VRSQHRAGPFVKATAVAAFAAVIVLGGCATRTSAPVISRGTASAPAPTPAPAAATPASRPVETGPEFYTVKRGDTLYSIALDHGTSYRELAEWNNLANPNVIRVDQVLRVRPPAEQSGVQVRPLAGAAAVEARPLVGGDAIKSEPKAVKMPYSDDNLALLSKPRPQVQAPAPVKPVAPAEVKVAPAEAKPAVAPEPKPAQSDVAEDDEKVEWGWPTAGKVTAGYSEGSNKGLDISGKSGQSVVASASGTVLYVGSGIRGYGKLIVIRHNKAYSTVYAHNSEILVKEGQRVVKGQKVAEMGNSDADQVKLHFEIRRLGKPIDPSKLLPAG
jgi:lipoprotein NlpD